jgi:hypothetical protein
MQIVKKVKCQKAFSKQRKKDSKIKKKSILKRIFLRGERMLLLGGTSNL